jgi:hypothetical protein
VVAALDQQSNCLAGVKKSSWETGSGGLAVAVRGGRAVAAQRAEVDIQVWVVRLGLEAEFMGGVFAEAADVLGQVRRDVARSSGSMTWPSSWSWRTVSAMSRALWKMTC